MVSAQHPQPILPSHDVEAIEIIIGENEIYPPLDSPENMEFRSETPYTMDNVRRIREGKTFIYCHGWFEYLDVFMNKHETVFCQSYNIGRNAFVPVGGFERNHGN